MTLESVEIIEEVRRPDVDLMLDCPSGEVRAIVFYPDERLTQVSEEVPPDFWGDQLNKLLSDMATTMYLCGGMGLSAVQVGVPLRVFICDIFANAPPQPKGMPRSQLLVAVNPTVEALEGSQTVGHPEGCLSFPGVHEVVERPNNAILRARDRHGNAYVLPTGGMLGRVIQHEMDHLDGKTFLDRMKPKVRERAEKAAERFHTAVTAGTIRVAAKPKALPGGETRQKARQKRKVAKKRGRR